MHECQTTTLLSKHCNKYQLCAGHCARSWEFSGDQDRLGFTGCSQTVKNTLGVGEAGVERFATEISCILCKRGSSCLSPHLDDWMPLWATNSLRSEAATAWCRAGIQ